MKDGYLLALSREHAKGVFSKKEDSLLAEHIDQLLLDEPLREAGCLLECGDSWQVAQDVLSNLGASQGAPLDQVLLGGRRLYQGEDRDVIVVRPDMVGHLAKALNDLDENALGDSAALIKKISAIYSLAAEQGGAIVFCTKNS